jgi:hypothetical protein
MQTPILQSCEGSRPASIMASSIVSPSSSSSTVVLPLSILTSTLYARQACMRHAIAVRVLR